MKKSKRKLKQFWNRVFHPNKGKVEIGSDLCPICGGQIPIAHVAGLHLTCTWCNAKLKSIQRS